MEARAQARYVRVTPMKARRVVDVIRGMKADEASALLRFAPQAAAEPVRKVLESAMANAEDSDGRRADSLYVAAGLCRRGPDHEAVPAACAGPRLPGRQAHEPHHHRH